MNDTHFTRWVRDAIDDIVATQSQYLRALEGEQPLTSTEMLVTTTAKIGVVDCQPLSVIYFQDRFSAMARFPTIALTNLDLIH